MWLLYVLLQISLASSASVLLPLYSYPEGDAWQPLLAAAAQHQAVDFLVVFNPSSGPGSSLDTNYATALAKLKAFNNIKLLGYVRTGYGDRATSDVTADIDQYASWVSSYPAEGIFLDEVAPDKASVYRPYAEHIRAKTWNDSSSFVVLNPGAPVDDEAYFGFADQIVLFESAYSSWTKRGFEHPSRTAVLIHSLTNTAVLASLVSELSGLGSLYITDKDLQIEDVYKGFGSTWQQFVSLLGDIPGASKISSNRAAASSSKIPATSVAGNVSGVTSSAAFIVSLPATSDFPSSLATTSVQSSHTADNTLASPFGLSRAAPCFPLSLSLWLGLAGLWAGFSWLHLPCIHVVVL